MSSPYIGEIRMFAGNFPPVGWMFCEGQLIPISENDTLFNLIGTTYGGDGQSTFALPNLASRVPIHRGSGPDGTTYQLGEMAGVESVTLTASQIPQHSHPMLASNDIGTLSTPQGNLTAQSAVKLYRAGNASVSMHPSSIAPVGGSQPHENMQPYLCINFIISLDGIYPTQN